MEARAAVRYLTVQDLIWINLQVTGNVYTFDYAMLEEAACFQYGYGSSTSLESQAARLFWAFANKRPFTRGNEATGFVGMHALLRINGLHMPLTDKASAELFKSLVDCSLLEQKTAAAAVGWSGPAELPVEDIVLQLLAEFPAGSLPGVPAAQA